MTVTVSATEFKFFVEAISQVDAAGGFTMKVYKDYIECLNMCKDNRAIAGYYYINTLKETDLPEGEECKQLNFKNAVHLLKLLKMHNEEEQPEFVFEVRGNAVYYHGTIIKEAKFILAELPPKNLGNRITIDFIKKFEPFFTAPVIFSSIKELTLASSFVNDATTVKAYVHQEGNKLHAELTDKEQKNVNSITYTLSNECEGEMGRSFIFPMSAFNMLKGASTKAKLTFSVEKCGDTTMSVPNLFFVKSECGGCMVKYLLMSRVS